MEAIKGRQRRHELIYTGAQLRIGTTPPDNVLRGTFWNESYDIADSSGLNIPLPMGFVYGSTIDFWLEYMINEALAPGNKNIQWRMVYEGLNAGEVVGAGTFTGTEDTGDILIPAVALTLARTPVFSGSSAFLVEGMSLGCVFSRIAAVGGAPVADPEVVALHLMLAVDSDNYKV